MKNICYIVLLLVPFSMCAMKRKPEQMEASAYYQNKSFNECLEKLDDCTTLAEVTAVIQSNPDYSLDMRNTGDNTLLHEAAFRGNYILAPLLIQSNADLDPQNKEGRTPLHESIRQGNNAISYMLIHSGADVSIPASDGNTALHAAAMRSNTDVVGIITQHGNRDVVNLVNEEGDTAMHFAASVNNLELVKMLDKSGANSNIRDNKGHAPADLTDFPDVFNYLAQLNEEE